MYRIVQKKADLCCNIDISVCASLTAVASLTQGEQAPADIKLKSRISNTACSVVHCVNSRLTLLLITVNYVSGAGASGALSVTPKPE